MMLKVLVYEGPIKGKIRCFFKKKQVMELYKELLEEMDLRYFEDYDLQKAIDEVNDAYRNNELGMYLFVNWKRHLICFGFVDMEMKDIGYYEWV